jgi:hypothetical protein
MLANIKPIKPIKQAFSCGLIWLPFATRELDLENQAKSSLSSQALDNSLFVSKSGCVTEPHTDSVATGDLNMKNGAGSLSLAHSVQDFACNGFLQSGYSSF